MLKTSINQFIVSTSIGASVDIGMSPFHASLLNTVLLELRHDFCRIKCSRLIDFFMRLEHSHVSSIEITRFLISESNPILLQFSGGKSSVYTHMHGSLRLAIVIVAWMLKTCVLRHLTISQLHPTDIRIACFHMNKAINERVQGGLIYRINEGQLKRITATLTL